jgi:hypothetical protein
MKWWFVKRFLTPAVVTVLFFLVTAFGGEIIVLLAVMPSTLTQHCTAQHFNDPEIPMNHLYLLTLLTLLILLTLLNLLSPIQDYEFIFLWDDDLDVGVS